MTIRILIISTGNVCRSPLAAQLLASRLDPAVFEIESAGTSVLVGDRMPESALQAATAMGASEATGHRAVALTREAVASADLILGMELEHRRRAAQLHPPAVRRAFTLPEFAHIASEMNYDRLASGERDTESVKTAAFETVTRMRGALTRLAPELVYDVEDPYGHSAKVYERSALQVESAVTQVVDFFERLSEIAQPNYKSSSDDFDWPIPTRSGV